jgi:hypothetical protein
LEAWLMGESRETARAGRGAASLLARRMAEHGAPDESADGLAL